ncbi:HAD-like domain-containing protein [Trichoderma velutinum]
MSAMAAPGPRRFAPLRAATELSPFHSDPILRGIIFDMDGTLCEPQTYMFREMRSVLGIPQSVDILEHIDKLPPHQQPPAHEAIRAIERKAMASQTPQPGLQDLMSYLEAYQVPKAICTRNFDIPVQHLISKFLPASQFYPVITRDFRPPKPHPAGIMHIAQSWGLVDGSGAVDTSGLIMVGDSLDDLTAGRLAGAATVLLLNDVNKELANHENTDMVIHKLDDLIRILENGFQGRVIDPGRLPL